MKIILARHGESSTDIEDRYEGDYDDDLTEKGKQQAKELAEKLASKQITTIYSSPLKRAFQTAETISKKIRVPVKVIQEFKERNNFGILTGLIKKEAREKFPKEVKELETNSPKHNVKNSEKFEDFKKRIEKAFDELPKKENETILIVTHAGPIRRIVSHALKKEIKSIRDCGAIEIEKKWNEYFLEETNGIELIE
jgi:broad specificity phosphatase PhoE